MKKMKILLLIAVLFFSISAPAHAQIHKKMTPTKIIFQSINIGNVNPLNVVDFSKNIDNPIVHTFWLTIFKGDSNYWEFSKQPSTLSIQGKEYSLDFVASKKNYDANLGYISAATFFILGDYADALSDADSAIITFHFDNKSDIIWKVPDSVLSEWKQVIELK